MSNKGPNVFLIFSLILAVVIIGGAVMVARGGGDSEPAQAAVNYSFDGEKLILEAVYQRCAPGERCIVVDTHCGFCCQHTAINAKFDQDFNAAFDKACTKFRGQSCNCYDLSSYPSCVEGTCQLVEWPDAK